MEINSIFLPIEAKLSMDLSIQKEELLQSINKLNEITKYMSNTIDDFRDFFATDKEKIEFKVLEQINSTINIISGGLKANNIKLDIIIQKNPILLGYKNEYSQVLINIINNAIYILEKHQDEKIINICVKKSDDKIIISVSDNGGGIDQENIEYIFEKNFTTKKNKKGSGLGLYICKQIVKDYLAGEITAKNTHNGASFTIYLPSN